jgi:hypothetical protein
MAVWGLPKKITATPNGVKVIWGNDKKFLFRGFTWGYHGEGPRGFQRFLTICGIKATDGTDELNPTSRQTYWQEGAGIALRCEAICLMADA